MIDPRLMPLLQILIEAGFGWVATEIMSVLEEGEGVEEPADNVHWAQEMARRSQQKMSESPVPLTEMGRHKIEDQLGWARAYLVSRISDTLTALSTSAEHLSEIVESARSRADEGPFRLTLVHFSDDQYLTCNIDSIVNSIEALGTLKTAIENWTIDIQRGEATDAQ